MAVEIEKESFELDRSGMLTIRRRYLADSKTEALTGLPRTAEGIPLEGIRGQVWISTTDGRHVVDAIYKGLIDDPDESYDDFEILTEEKEQKIESFEPMDILEEEYGAFLNPNTQRLEFPDKVPRTKNKIGKPLTLDTMGEQKYSDRADNPLFGATTYAVPYSTASWRLVRKKVPQSLIKQERTVIDKLPNGFDYSGPKKQWYVRPLQKRKSGNAWTIEWVAFEISEFKDAAVLLALRAAQAKR